MSGIVGTSHTKSKVIGRSLDTAKAWIFFNGGSVSGTGTGGMVNSFNVSSLTDNGTGNYDVNFIANMATTDYVTVTTGYNYDIICSARDEQKSNVQVNSWAAGATALYDMEKHKVLVFGD